MNTKTDCGMKYIELQWMSKKQEVNLYEITTANEQNIIKIFYQGHEWKYELSMSINVYISLNTSWDQIWYI